MNKSGPTLVFVIMASTLLFVQSVIVSMYGQTNDATISSSSNLTVPQINSSIVDTKLKTQFPDLDVQKTHRLKLLPIRQSFCVVM